MSLKDDYYATMVSQFKRWDARFSMLTEPGGETITMADARHTEQKTMRANRDAAYRKLQEIRTASESAWRSLQSEVDERWLSIEDALNRARRSAAK